MSGLLGNTYEKPPCCLNGSVGKGRRARKITHTSDCERFMWRAQCYFVLHEKQDCTQRTLDTAKTHTLQILINQRERALSKHTKTIPAVTPTHSQSTHAFSPVLLTLEASFNKMHNSITADNSAEGPLNSLKFH